MARGEARPFTPRSIARGVVHYLVICAFMGCASYCAGYGWTRGALDAAVDHFNSDETETDQKSVQTSDRKIIGL